MSRAEQVVLRQVVAARAGGDQRAALDAWRELLTISFDRIRTLVFSESHRRLSRPEQEDAIGLACMRLTEMARRGRGFRGVSMGEYVNLLKVVVKRACIDVQRREARHSRHRAALHASDGGEEGERYTREAYDAIVREHDEREEALEAAQALRELGGEFLDWALPRLSPAQRAMAECDREGLTVEQAMSRLGKKRDAVYKLRERAMEALRKLYEEWQR